MNFTDTSAAGATQGMAFSIRLAVITVCLSVASLSIAQDIEPRRWTPLPIGLNVLGMGIVYTEGDIAFDPVLVLEDVTVEQTMGVVTYQHAFGLVGKSARFDVRLPYKYAQWEGRLEGVPGDADRKGPGDPRLRLSINFIGAPALEGNAYQDYQALHPVNTVVGAALAVTLPYGDYNDKFFRDSEREQDPLYALQSHLVYIAPQRWWVSLGAAHGRGGESTINGDKKDDERRDWLYGISAGLPIGSRSSVKLDYVGSRTSEDVGKDTDTISLAYSIRF